MLSGSVANMNALKRAVFMSKNFFVMRNMRNAERRMETMFVAIPTYSPKPMIKLDAYIMKGKPGGCSGKKVFAHW